jgi:TonB-dependent receptor
MDNFALNSFMDKGSFFQNTNGDLYANFNYQILNNSSVSTFFTQNESLLREVPMNTSNYEYNQWVGSSYTYKEHQGAGFAMFTYTGKNLDLLSGLRVEHTYLIETSDTLTNQLALDSSTNTYYNVPKSITIFRPYIGFLPSFHLNWYVNKKTNLKFGVSRTMHRPNFEETKPGQAVIKYNELDFTFGNPNLKPVFSINFDIEGEFYFSETSVLTLGTYFKQISNHIYTLSTPNTDPISGATIRYFANASNSWVGGLELFYTQKFAWIHPVFKNVGIRMNASLSDSRMQIVGRSKNQKMTKQVPFLGAFELFYENEKFEFHTNLSYTSRYLNELNLTYLNGELLHKDSDFDVFMNDFINLEASCLLHFSQKIKLKAELGNILNYGETKSRGKEWRTLNKEFFGLRGEIGVVFSF